MQSDSLQWKRKRLLILDIGTIAIFAVAIPTAIYLYGYNATEWSAYTNAKHWAKCTAHVTGTSIVKDWGSKYKKNLVVRMTLDGGPAIEDSFFSLRLKDAEAMQRNLEKVGTVTVYRNNLQKDDYALSPEMKGHMRYSPPMLLGIVATIVGLVTTGILWRYLRIQIDVASGLRHRFGMDSARENAKESALEPSKREANAPKLEFDQGQLSGSKIELSPEKIVTSQDA